MAVLDNICNSSDVKNLSVKELETLTDEIREKIIKTTFDNGGHLSSNLGIVETTVALYHEFDYPKDKLIFDVGHQCYAHKILSGRKDKFNGLRTEGGISGFPDSAESEFDAFSSGHAGNSLAAGLGICAARDKLKEDFCVTVVVGDGAFSNGLNLEALTASNSKPQNFIVILNDNGMSISSNSNGLYKTLSKRTLGTRYVKSKNFFKKLFGESFITRALRRFREFIKRLLNGDGLIEQYGFKYVGVIDGNNIKELTKTLSKAKAACKNKAVFLHVKTVKGKGYKEAEEHADTYHGVGKNLQCTTGAFSNALGESLCNIIEKDSKVIAITAGMKDGTGLTNVEEKFPDNFFDVGIAEEYAVTFAAGLAKGGLKPVVAIYSTFLQRAYDEIMHDVCEQNLPVIFCIDRAGCVGADGKTHQGVFDLSYLGHIPNITVLAPKDARDFDILLKYAFSLNSPVAIRYPKDCKENIGEANNITSENLWQVESDGDEVAILAVGGKMLKIAEQVKEQYKINAKIISARFVKPLDEKMLLSLSMPIVTIEDNALLGGFGAAVLEFVSQNNMNNRVKTFGIKDEYVAHSTIDSQFSINGLTKEKIGEKMLDFLKK